MDVPNDGEEWWTVTVSEETIEKEAERYKSVYSILELIIKLENEHGQRGLSLLKDKLKQDSSFYKKED